MSDEEALAIVQKALKSGSLKQRNTVTTVTGIMGSGKTCLLCRLFRIKLPDEYTSTGVTGNSFRGLMHRIAKVGSFELLTNEQILQFLAPLLIAGMPEANVVALAKRFSEMQASGPSQPPSEKMLPSSNPSQPTTTSAPSAPLTHTSASTDADIQAKETHSTKTMVSFVQKSKKSTETLLLELIHMIDTGGQPEFMEVMPSVIHNSNLTLLVLNLLHSLDECPKLSLHEEGKAFVKPITSKHTNRQILRQLISTMQAKRGKKVSVHRSKLLVVATHKDCIDKQKLAKVMNDLNKELKSILLPMMENELIMYGKEGEIACAINLKNPDQDDEKILDSIRLIIPKVGLGVEIETPLSLFMFEQDIIKFAEEQGRHVMVVSFRECIMVGGRLQMTSEVVQAALIYFHQHNIFLYFRSILPNLVFLNPQVPLDFVNAIVRFSYQAKSGAIQPLTAQERRFCREAIITEELLEHNSLYTSFVPGLYEPHHAIDLFQHIYTIAPLSVNKSENPDSSRQPSTTTANSSVQPSEATTAFEAIKEESVSKVKSSSTIPQKNIEYLMMCLLTAIPDNEVVKFLPSDQVSPIVMKFSNNCAPNGAFGNTVSCLISDFKWIISRKYEELTPQCLAHNVVTLSPDIAPVKITLVNSTKWFEMHVESGCMEDVLLRKYCPQLLNTVLSAISKVFQTMRIDEIEVKPAFLCPCGSTSSAHIASTFPPESCITTDSQLVCSKQGMIIGKLQWSQGTWFQNWHGDKQQSTIKASTSPAGSTGPECQLTRPVEKKKGRLPSTEGKPTLPELIIFKTTTSSINIVKRIGTHFLELGPVLLHDDDGMMTQAITDECHHNAAKINYEILKRWIQGEGKKPLQWSTLIDVLKKVELSELANIIEENLQ